MGLWWEGSRPFAMTFFISEATSGWSFIARLNWKEISSRKLRQDLNIYLYTLTWTIVECNSYFSLWCDEELFSCCYAGKFKCWLIWRFKAYPVLTHSIWFGLGAGLFPKAWLNNNLHRLIWKQGDVDLWGVLYQCQHNIFCSLNLLNTKCFKFHFHS